MFYRPCPSIKELTNFFKENNIEKVLDYGAGKLRNSFYLSKKGFKVYAADTTKQINRVNLLSGVNNLDALINESYLPECRLNVGLVVSNYVLNIIETYNERINYIDNAYSNLKDGGYFLVEVRRKTSITPTNCNKAFSKEELDGLVLSRGFVKIKDISTSNYLANLYQKNAPIIM